MYQSFNIQGVWKKGGLKIPKGNQNPYIEEEQTTGLCSQRINTNKMFMKINEIIDANMDTVTNNSFLFIINSKTVHA
jgi:hypothetical protein